MEKVSVILGPTASGKTAYAIALAKKHGGSIISADSRQIYAGMNIGTAKPPIDGENTKSRAQNAKQITNSKSQVKNQIEAHGVLVPDVIDGISHYLLNIREPNNQMTLPQWQAAAYHVIDHIISQGQYPILAGGTMLYIDSVLFNYDIPTITPNDSLRSRLEQLPAGDLYAKLIDEDPEAAEFIEPQNKRRIIRALEVMESAGKTFSRLRRKRKLKYNFEITGLFPGWDELKNRIAERVEHMFMNGLLEETEKLREMYEKDLPLLKTINYAQAAAMLDGSMDKKKALDEMIRANFRYARRQMSWWRNRSEITWIS